MRWRNLSILLLGHVVGSYVGAALLVALARAIDHRFVHSFWVLLKGAPVKVPQFFWFFVVGPERPKLLAVMAVVVGYTAAFYGCWKLSHRFRAPQSDLERRRGFEVAVNKNGEC
jgi:L-lactate permease